MEANLSLHFFKLRSKRGPLTGKIINHIYSFIEILHLDDSALRDEAY